MTQRTVLLACGSFSPPTPMHLRMFEIAKNHFESLGTHKVIGGIVSPVHDAYGKKDLISASHRCAMLKLALRTSDWIKVSEWEVNQEGWTKTRYSLQYHRNYINAYIKACCNGSTSGPPPPWMPDEINNFSMNNSIGIDETDSVNANYQFINEENDNFSNNSVQLKLLCGADLLESFATPGLWSPEDLEIILGEYGLVVITRSGNNPEKFIYDSDVLTKYRRNITIITNWVPNEVSSTMIRRLIRRGESVKYLIDDSIISYVKMHQLYGSCNKNTTETVHAFSS
ncbi:nicotinamide mononucleotide adenylyltransferase isoform X2 [Arctopsyche grandis]|uniref:nicotinamide mononucleotide adenylyltransferase isoform X2 n=1 Tax=Arctopsyche grandis TaxID=121162 RepID=UPI00406DA3D7